MRKIILALTLLFPITAHAQFAPPQGSNYTQFFLQDYNLTISWWAYDTGLIGAGVGWYEYHPSDGKWYGCSRNQWSNTFNQDIANAGGPYQYMLGPGAAKLDYAAALCYPPIGGPPNDSNTVDGVNAVLGQFKIVIGPNGYPVVAPK